MCVFVCVPIFNVRVCICLYSYLKRYSVCVGVSLTGCLYQCGRGSVCECDIACPCLFVFCSSYFSIHGLLPQHNGKKRST